MRGRASGIAAGGGGGGLIITAMILAGIVGGTAWAAVPAVLRTRFSVNEILSSLMLTYVALQVLGYLVGGPWKDPNGRNFPATAPLTPDQSLPILFPGTTVHLGVAIALILPFVFWLVMSRSVFGFQIRVVGSAPHAARHGGFDSKQTIWLAMLIGGGMAGLAGALEFTGALKTINLGFPSGYGFTAIIVVFLGRLHPIGVPDRRHRAGGDLCRRAGGADHRAHPQCHRRHLPGDDAVLHSRQRHPRALPAADRPVAEGVRAVVAGE